LSPGRLIGIRIAPQHREVADQHEDLRPSNNLGPQTAALSIVDPVQAVAALESAA
jgi:hypothetical protein